MGQVTEGSVCEAWISDGWRKSKLIARVEGRSVVMLQDKTLAWADEIRPADPDKEVAVAEMANIILDNSNGWLCPAEAHGMAETLYDAGYRKMDSKAEGPFRPLSLDSIPDPDVLCIIQRTNGQWMIASRCSAPLSTSGVLSSNCHWYSFVELGRPVKAVARINCVCSFNDQTVKQWAYLHEALPSGNSITASVGLASGAQCAENHQSGGRS